MIKVKVLRRTAESNINASSRTQTLFEWLWLSGAFCFVHLVLSSLSPPAGAVPSNLCLWDRLQVVHFRFCCWFYNTCSNKVAGYQSSMVISDNRIWFRCPCTFGHIVYHWWAAGQCQPGSAFIISLISEITISINWHYQQLFSLLVLAVPPHLAVSIISLSQWLFFFYINYKRLQKPFPGWD